MIACGNQKKWASMSFMSFLNDPKLYLATHEMYVASGMAQNLAMTSDAGKAIPGVAGISRQRWHQRPNGPFLTMGLTVNAAAQYAPVAPNAKSFAENVTNLARKLPFAPRSRKQYVLGTTNNDVGFRYLPFVQSHATYMRIHGNNVNFVLTGPLTGCSIGVVRNGNGELWIIHAHDNLNNGVGARLNQAAAINYVATNRIHGNNVQICEYLRDYHGMGFVFGRLRGNVWKFYSHATSQTGQTQTIKWADI
jgi:hypothetical protein